MWRTGPIRLGKKGDRKVPGITPMLGQVNGLMRQQGIALMGSVLRKK